MKKEKQVQVRKKLTLVAFVPAYDEWDALPKTWFQNSQAGQRVPHDKVWQLGRGV